MTTTLTRSAAALPPGAAAGPARGSAQRAALITVILAVIFQPVLHPTGPGNSSPVDLLLIASIVTALIWLAATHRKLRAPYVIPVLLFIAAGTASGLVSPLPSTALISVMIDILLFAWCTTVVNVVSGPRAMRYALTAWSWSGIFWAALCVAAWAAHLTPLEGIRPATGNRLAFTFGDPNYASWYWDATIFVVFASRVPGRRWMRFAGYGFLVWALALTESNGGIVALVVGIVFLLMLRYYRRYGWAGALATLLVTGLAAGTFFAAFPLSSLRQWALSSHQVLLVNSIGRSAQSSSERGLLIQESISVYQHSDGVLGLGPMSTKQLLANWLYPYSNEAHDDWLAALGERGVLGLLALLMLAGCVVSRAGPVLRRPLSAAMAAAVPAPAGIVAGVLVLGVNSFFEEVLHFRTLFGIIAVLGRDAWLQHHSAQQRRFAGLRPAAVHELVTLPPATTPAGRQAAGTVRRSAAPCTRPVAVALPGAAPASASRNTSRQVMTNLGAQGGALACVSVASLLVARVGGPTVLGYYALLRVLPWLFGVIISCGLPTAAAYYMAGEHGKDRRSRPTICLLAVIGAGISALAWIACAVPFHHIFFRQMPLELILAMTISVVASLWNVTAKACCQGSGDIAGANLLIVAEEFWFVPTYVTVRLVTGDGGLRLMVASLIVSGALYTGTALVRLTRHGFFRGWGLPSLRLARRIVAFGSRGQLGNMLWLMNLRFDFVLIGALAGPAVLGVYAVASKFAELMRLIPTAVNYVLYPRFAHAGKAEASAEARRLLPLSTALTLAMTPFLAAATLVALPIIYGHAYRGAVTPAEIIIIGLSVEGAAAVASAYLVGIGRPGLNSVGMGVGTIITVTLDVILIPRLGAIGGAITSAVTYLTTTVVLFILARGQIRAQSRADGFALARLEEIRADSRMRRSVDLLVSGVALAISGPVILVLGAAVRFTSRGPAFYRQVRVGRSSAPFTIFKLRSMVTGADRAGPLVTSHADARVTRLGAVLRATKLDELPQLINVLKGDMTLIGPRPEVPRYIPCYFSDELKTLNVRPGLTGAGQIFYTLQEQQAQVSGAEDAEQHYISHELHAKLGIDLDYLRRRSLRYDLTIVLRTVLLVTGLGKRVPAPAPRQGAPTIVPSPRAGGHPGDDTLPLPGSGNSATTDAPASGPLHRHKRRPD
jgi:lipopolysaccharide/colanic/teichoic acid biosynthesis glycosyltransferase/O-antigen/teichoic acid export membrane protein